ncbi:helix-turn-helix domain-containing protein [Micrococcus sp. EYE_162]|uniref:helix-turn-helix domain-containing protein n=1 Tax=unclassified Micrococcus TaxID=2620948 RepID=UPI002005D9ED|nr:MULTISPECIES: helix-turn-helix domain-containing protein [unclassified Micrococcus]MCK6096160.1 helix-turn-helix domain-containing protein [Micrococcus sp. EYE_212]MCK6172251.1 helix-turn-helix domain-containing protein [Micrococcus sp. EYE_162]
MPVPSLSHAGRSASCTLEPHLTLAEVAEITGTSLPTVRRWVARGELPAYRFGARSLRVDPADLRAMRKPVTPLAEMRGADAR